MSDEITLTIDGQELSVPKGTLVIRAAEQLGITIPRFCDHPLLDPIGACRQCFVEVEGQRKPMIACTTMSIDGMVVKTHFTSEVARKDQEATLEFLLINHPLDCPMCDKGGECPLQDQALAHGPADSRFVDQKRRYAKPVAISTQIALDRERCVLCARCTRFSQEISGDPFIELFERGALEQVAIYEDEPYESVFSGNVVQICPVGALTSTSYRFRSRPFDLRSFDGVCNQCSAGCNLRVDVRAGEITRQLAAENMAVNEMWSCDKGRFGFEFVAHESRLREPQMRSHLGLQPTSWQRALGRAAEAFGTALDSGGPETVGVLTGGRLTDEDAYALGRFTRDVLGSDNLDFRMRPRTDEERDVLAAVAGTVGPTYDDVERADVVVIAGLEPREEVPILYLRLRKAWRKHRQRIVFVGPALGALSDIAWRWMRTAPGGEASVLQALTQGRAPDDLAELLSGDNRVVVLAGERLAQSPAALASAAALAASGGHSFAWVPRRAGARGAIDAGLLPGLLPGGRRLDGAGSASDLAWDRVPEAVGKDSRQMLEAAAAGELSVLYLVGADPARDFEDRALAKAALRRVETLIVQDLLPTESLRYADIVLPASAPQERVGSFTTWEGRRQPFEQAVPPQGLALQDWDIIRQLAQTMGRDMGWETAMDVRREAAPVMQAAGPAGDRLGQIHPPVVERDRTATADGEFEVVAIDRLLGSSSTLVGADELLATARPAAVWLNAADAADAEIGGGDPVTLVSAGPAGHEASTGGRLQLPAVLTDTVVRGAVVVPARLSPPNGTRVRLEKVAQPVAASQDA